MGRLDGVVMLAPMLNVDQVKRKPINRILLPISGVLAVLTPLLPVAAKAKNVMYPEMRELFDKDPLCYSAAVRAHMAVECLAVVDDTMDKASKLTAPVVVFHSKNDTMTDPEGSVAFVG